MEERLIPKSEGERSNWWFSWPAFVGETKMVGYLTGPMVAVTISQYLLQVISTMMVGHLGKLALSSSAIAISLAGVTRFCLLQGMACALETLCGQAWSSAAPKSRNQYLHCHILFDLSLHPSVAPMAIHGKATYFHWSRSLNFT